MNRMICGCVLLAALLWTGRSNTAEAHWRGIGVSVNFGAPAYYGYGYRSYGWATYPRYYGGYYGGYYGAYPTHLGYGPAFVGYPAYGYGYAAPVYYGGCGW